MEILNGFEKIPLPSKNSIIAIGNFDGIHLGHKKILECLTTEAKNNALLSLVLTFSPHPERILGEKRIKMIQTLDQRVNEMKKFGIDAILIIPFDEKFSSLSSHDFIQKIIVDRLKAKAVIIGENFRFGKNREGDISLLFRLASGYNLKIHSIPPVTKEDMIVSSSIIRNFLKEGKIEKANVLLGRFYEVTGKVIKGKSRGKTLGFPTANIKTENEIIPQGVFISTTGIGPETFSSLTNVGKCPTFNQKEINIESYIMNLNKDIYGKKIRIHFLKKIRDEMKFKTQAELSQQIKKDLELAKSYFKLKP